MGVTAVQTPLVGQQVKARLKLALGRYLLADCGEVLIVREINGLQFVVSKESSANETFLVRIHEIDLLVSKPKLHAVKSKGIPDGQVSKPRSSPQRFQNMADEYQENDEQHRKRLAS